MHVGTHFLAGWLVAVPRGELTTRERGAIAFAGVAPDLDGLGLLFDKVIRATGRESFLYEDWHHVLAHNIGAALVFSAACATIAGEGRRRLVFLLAFGSVHLHLFFDILGSRGMDGGQWPIPYLAPFSQAWQLTWSGQWHFNSWQNTSLLALLLLGTVTGAWKYGRSPVGLISQRWDALLTDTLRARFGSP